MSESNKELESNQIHLWKINIDDSICDLDHIYRNILSSDERNRVDRLKSEKDRRRVTISRGMLRKRLAKYLEMSPSEIAFSYNKHGKPSIESRHNLRDIKFNVSHSGKLIIYAIRQNKEIGVDLEYIREVEKADKIVGRFFTKEESDYYYSQPEDKKKLTFFELWTRKEAYSKAMGKGIGLPSSDFDISLLPSHINNSNNETKWSLIDIHVEKNYTAAIATEGDKVDICSCQFKTTSRL